MFESHPRTLVSPSPELIVLFGRSGDSELVGCGPLNLQKQFDTVSTL